MDSDHIQQVKANAKANVDKIMSHTNHGNTLQQGPIWLC